MSLQHRQPQVRAAGLGRRCSPSLLVAAFVSLGWWQIGRAREKQAMIESFERGAQHERRARRVGHRRAAALPARVGDAASTNPRARSCSTTCRRSTGQPGYRVLTPLATRGRRATAAGRSRLGAARRDAAGQLPDVAVERWPANGGRPARRPAGSRPARRRRAGATATTGWPRVLNFPIAGRRRGGARRAGRIADRAARCVQPRRIRARLAPVGRLPAGAPPRLRDPVVRTRADADRDLRRAQPAQQRAPGNGAT